MRIAITGRNLDILRKILQDFPFDIVTEKPDVVISYGGDGALLGAERAFPGVPKLPVRDRSENFNCQHHGEAETLQKLLDGNLREFPIMKLEATANNCTVAGINDVIVNKQNIASAVRYSLWLDNEIYETQIVGDGVVVASPFGSTGFYRSITRSFFRTGIGIAFNNSTEPLDHLVVLEDTAIEVEIIRGPAVLLADNDPLRIALSCGDTVAIRKSDQETVILGLDIFRCKVCYQLRQQNGGTNKRIPV